MMPKWSLPTKQTATAATTHQPPEAPFKNKVVNDFARDKFQKMCSFVEDKKRSCELPPKNRLQSLTRSSREYTNKSKASLQKVIRSLQEEQVNPLQQHSTTALRANVEEEINAMDPYLFQILSKLKEKRGKGKTDRDEEYVQFLELGNTVLHQIKDVFAKNLGNNHDNDSEHKVLEKMLSESRFFVNMKSKQNCNTSGSIITTVTTDDTMSIASTVSSLSCDDCTTNRNNKHETASINEEKKTKTTEDDEEELEIGECFEKEETTGNAYDEEEDEHEKIMEAFFSSISTLEPSLERF